MFTGESDKAWKAYGRTEPYYGVLSDERFRKKHLTPRALEEFFRSGEQDLDFFLATIRRHFDPQFTPKRALDFGCGVGRLTIPLARISSEVVAADVSTEMIAEAKRNCERRSISNVEFVQSDDRLSAVTGKFDFILSYIVFQHIPSRRSERILRAILDRLADGGFGCLHFNYTGPGSWARRVFHHARKIVPLLNNFANLMERKPFFAPMMQMNRANLNRVFCRLQKCGCENVIVRFTNHGNELGLILFFKIPGA